MTQRTPIKQASMHRIATREFSVLPSSTEATRALPLGFATLLLVTALHIYTQEEHWASFVSALNVVNELRDSLRLKGEFL